MFGTGTLVANVVKGGAIRPGTSPGILTLQGNYTQLSTGSLNVELGGTSPGTGHDQLVVAGATQLAGTLSLSLVGGHQPVVGAHYRFLTSGTTTGAFEKLTGSLLTNGRRLEPAYDASGAEIQVVSP